MLLFQDFSKRMIAKICLGVVLEFGPVILFLATFEMFHIYKATTILMIATIVSTIITFRLQKRLPYFALYVAFLTVLFGYLTITHHNPKFIQIRDTLYDTLCALTLLVGLMINVSFLKVAFHSLLPMTQSAWTKLTHLWIAFFLVNACVNEYVRRTMSLVEWFDFKAFIVVATVLFGIISLIASYKKEETH